VVMKFGLVLLVLGVITFGVYSFTSKPNFEDALDADQSSLQAKVQSAEIYPKTAYTSSTLQLKMVAASREEYAYLSVRWFRNDNEIPAVAGPRLESKYVHKGDRIHAEVNLLGPDALDAPVITTPVHILNTPPTINAASVALRTDPTDVIYARVDGVDADGDHLRYTYRWFRNGSEIKGANKPVLPVENFAQGDKIYAEVVATDGDDPTLPYQCESLTLGSNAPQITSSPPNSFTPDRRYVYQVTVDAPDPTLLNYQLVKGPDGMKVSSTGLINWDLPTRAAGTRDFEVLVRVVDPTGGEATQSFTISLSAQAAEEQPQ